MTRLQRMHPWLAAALTWCALFAPATAAADSRTLCVYDPAGKSGDYYRILEEWTLEASGWGDSMTIRAYTDEETAAKDYEAGQCDGVVATGVRLQRFNRFPTTIEAIGALPDYKHLNQLVNTFVKYPSAAKYLRKGEHETVGIIPVGKVYLFTRDRNVDTVAELAGKRIATLDYDEPSKVMVERVGSIMVPADLGSLGPKFNNGDVDVCFATAPVYEPFELHRGMGTKGGVANFPIAQATLQVLIRHEKFSPEVGAKSRAWWAGKFGQMQKLIEQAESGIPANLWMDIPAEKHPDFEDMFSQVRTHLKDKGVYDATMLSTMKRIRCASDASRAECAN